MDEKEIQKRIQQGRNFVRMPLENEGFVSDQQQKKPQPPLFKEPMGGEVIALPHDFDHLNIENDFLKIINERKSHRVYTEKNLSLLELSYLLWCTQGVKSIRGKKYATIRTVPCGGARHEFETYLAVKHVEGLKEGLYHYLPQDHSLELLKEETLNDFIGKSLKGQVWADKASVCFYYSFVPYRAEWRYGIYAHRVVLIDAGHITENLYLACTSIGLGGCAIGYIDPDVCNSAFALDNENEYIFYAMPVGTVDEETDMHEDDIYAFVKQQGL